MKELNVDTGGDIYLAGVEEMNNFNITSRNLYITPKAGVSTIKVTDSELNVTNDLNVTGELVFNTTSFRPDYDSDKTTKSLSLEDTQAVVGKVVTKILNLKNSNMKIGSDTNTLNTDSYTEELVLDENSALEAETDHNNANSIPFYATVTDLSQFKIADASNNILSTTKDTNNRFIAINSDNSIAKHIFISVATQQNTVPTANETTQTATVVREDCPSTGENTLIYAVLLLGSTCGIIVVRNYKKRLG